LGWIRFYLIRDHDYLPDDIARHYIEHASGRLYVLKRYHIENYLLDDEVIAKVQTDIFSRPTNPDTVRSAISRIARDIAGEVLRDMVAYRLNLVYRPQDFSLGRIFQGQAFLDHAGRWDDAIVEEFHGQLATKVSDTNNALLEQTDNITLQRLVTECQRVVTDAIDDDRNDWRIVFPGRRLLEEYAKTEHLGKAIVLQNSIIKELGNSAQRVPNELQHAIEIVATGGTFAPP
jgi:hypothetical protein